MNSSVSLRQLAGYGVALAAIAALGIFGIGLMNDIQDQSDRIARTNVPELLNVRGAETGLQQHRDLQVQLGMARSLDEKVRITTLLNGNEHVVADHLDELRRIASDPDAQAWTTRQRAQWRQYLRESAEAISPDRSIQDDPARALYQGQSARVLEALSRSLRGRQEQLRSEIRAIRESGRDEFKFAQSAFLGAILIAAALLAAFALWSVVIRPLRRANTISAYRRSFLRALEMTDTEGETLDVAGHALRNTCSKAAVELLLVDSSEVHIERALVVGPDVNVPRCPVNNPLGCAAIRRGQAMVFPSSESVDACPHLRDRPTGPCSAVCTPVSIVGKAIGVIHAVGPVGKAPGQTMRDILEVTGALAGSRLGVIRSLGQSRHQASTDPLTGLLNRRSLHEGASSLRTAAVPYVVAMADLDHFKKLNDTHGHETGDRALRAFARVLKETTRIHDLVSRYGGEEFVVVLPRSSTGEAADVMARTRAALTRELAETGVPEFTFSAGLAEAGPDETFHRVLLAADEALLAAKRSGRDRTLIASPIRTDTEVDPLPVTPGAE